jgi:hypothetical protein
MASAHKAKPQTEISGPGLRKIDQPGGRVNSENTPSLLSAQAETAISVAWQAALARRGVSR